MTVENASCRALGRAAKATAADLRREIGPIFAAFEKSGLPIVVTDPRRPDNPIVFVNEAFSHVTGFGSDEAVGRNCRFLQTPETDQETLSRIRDAVTNGRAVSAKLLNRRKDDSRFWNSVFITPVCDEAGAPQFFISTQIDVTPVHETEETQAALQKELDATNERIRLTLTAAGAGGFWDWDIPNARFAADGGAPRCTTSTPLRPRRVCRPARSSRPFIQATAPGSASPSGAF